MIVTKVKERKDGSADITFSLSEKEVEILLQYTIKELLLKEIKKYDKVQASSRK